MGSRKEESYLIVDIDNQHTKTVLVETDGTSHVLKGVNETDTTIDPPNLDVTLGVTKSIQNLEENLDIPILIDDVPSKNIHFLCSSSTSGGLHMVVAGLIGQISAESAQRAALGAGALLMDRFAKDDSRPVHEKIMKMRSLNPDILLLAGGTDGGATRQVLEMADLIKTADIKPRFGSEYQLPMIYAGNVQIRDNVKQILDEDDYAMRMVENVRPIISKENLGPAREGIYDSYMEHVIIHSPGYDKLLQWTSEPVIPTQAAIGKLLYAYAERRGVNLIGVDVGGETTDMYSVFNGIFNRSLNADFGLTHGISNIMKITGIENILRWLPHDMDEREVRNIIGNMMINPPETLNEREKLVQAAAAREALAMGLAKHKEIASRLKGTTIDRTLSDMFEQALESTHIDLMKTNVIIGRGKVFRDQPAEGSTHILLDSLQPEGVTELLIDTTSIMPHLGSLYKLNQEAALGILVKDSLRSLGTCISLKGEPKESETALRYEAVMNDGTMQTGTVNGGELKTLPLKENKTIELTLYPGNRMNVGAGRGKPVKKKVTGGILGLIFDARGRPLRKYRKQLVGSSPNLLAKELATGVPQ